MLYATVMARPGSAAAECDAATFSPTRAAADPEPNHVPATDDERERRPGLSEPSHNAEPPMVGARDQS